MTKGKLAGAIPPMITSFTPEGEIDEGKLRDLVEFLSERVHGLFVCGSYGSGPLMRTDQREQCATVAIDQTRGRIPVIVHVGTPSTEQAVRLAKHATEVGADRIASVPPYYYGHTEDAVLRYYDALVKAVDLPVYVYNNPKTVGYAISSELMNRLAGIGIAGVKDSSFDLMVFSDFLQKVEKTGFDVVMGTEALFLPGWAVGARAFIPGLGNAFPELVTTLYDACAAGDIEAAREAHYNVVAVRDLMRMGGSTVVSVYEMLRLRGIDAGVPKAPFQLYDDATRGKLADALKERGLI